MPSSAQPTAAPDLTRMRRPEQLGRVGHADETGRGHLEHAELVRRAEAVLRRAQDAVLVVAVALELEDAVDEVLEHARPRDRAVLRDVSDEHRRDAGLLRDAQEPRCGLAHLRHRAGRRPERRGVQRLHRVDDADVRPLRFECRAHGVELGLGEDLDILGPAEPRRAKRDLRSRLLAGHEQCATSAARDRPERLEQERRLADARLSPDEHERGRNEPASEHAVQLGNPGGDAFRLVDRDVAERNGRAGRAVAESVAEPCSSSTSVPNAPQPGHLPSQRPDVVPQSEQVNWTVTFATGVQSRNGIRRRCSKSARSRLQVRPRA